MGSSRRAVTALVVLTAALLVACGPNAWPVADNQPSDIDSPAEVRGESPLSGAASAIQPQVPPTQLFGGTQAVPAGRILVVRDGALWIWEKGHATEIGVGWTWYQPRWSPDGSSFAFVTRAANFSDIFVQDASTGVQTQLTRSSSRFLEDLIWNFRPAWSPDGSRIAFVSDAASLNPVLWTMDAADGSARSSVQLIGLAQSDVDEIAWSPDGENLAVTLFEDSGPSQVALVPIGDATSSGSQLLVRQSRIISEHPRGAMDPAWSPDGNWIAYAAREGRGTDLFVMRPDGSGRQRLTSNGFARSPEWSPDGKSLAYLSSESGSFEVWAMDLTAVGDSLQVGEPRQLTRDLNLDATSGLSWGP